MTGPHTSATPQEPTASPLSAPAGYAFPRDAEGLLAWPHAERLLEGAHYYWLATTRPDGRPHVTPLWGVWLDGAFYFDGHPRTRWARNLAAKTQRLRPSGERRRRGNPRRAGRRYHYR